MKSPRRSFFLLTLSFLLLAGGCEHFPTNANTAFRNYTLNLFRDDVSSNTLNLHFTLRNPENFGITDEIINLGHFYTDPSASLAFFENCEAVLRKFSYTSLSDENKLTYDVLSSYINIEKKGADFYLYAEPLSPVTGIHTTLPILLSEYPLHNENDIQTYFALLKTLPDYFQSLIQFEQAKSASGLFMSDSVLEEILEQCQAFVDMDGQNYMHDTFIERLSELPTLSEDKRLAALSEHQRLIQEYVYPSYQALMQALYNLKGTGRNEKGLCYYPNGSEYFSYLISAEIGSSKSIEEIKQRVESQIADDLLQMNALAEPVCQESLNYSPLQTIELLKEGIQNAFPESVPVTVEIKFVPKTLEEHLSPAFYFIPAIDDFQSNVIYINQGYDLDYLDLFTTLAHEGFPGHLYQNTFFAATSPNPIRHLLSFKGYVEGWATYAEMCSYYIAPVDKSFAICAQKKNSLLLGLHARADLGIHYDGWSLSDTISFFSKYGITDSNIITEIYHYILGDPVNYLSYYVGYLEILDLKQHAHLSQKEFHEKILKIGPAPFSVIEKWF